jgi:methylglutaconyl-CoA hydratase
MSSDERAPLAVERRDDLLFVRLDDPSRANALSPAMVAALTETYRRDWRAEGVRAILLGGSGKHFCAGADLAHLRSLQSASALDNRLDSKTLRDLFAAILEQEALTLAMVQGSCVAGGCGVATACDFVVAASDARFLYSEVRIGFVAALVATFLPLRVRGSDLRELLLNPDFVPAEKALAIGLVNRVVPRDQLATATEALAGEILTRASSDSLAATKRLILDLAGLRLEERLDLASEVNAAARATADCRRGIATFLETKAPPRWRERSGES